MDKDISNQISREASAERDSLKKLSKNGSTVLSKKDVLEKPVIGLMPNYPKKNGKMYSLDLGQNVSICNFI